MSGRYTDPIPCPDGCLPGWFDRRRQSGTVRRDRRIFNVLCSLDGPITAQRVGQYIARANEGTALMMMNDLTREGHMRIISPPGSKPKTFEWTDQPKGDT